jgi:hypothetical protein
MLKDIQSILQLVQAETRHLAAAITKLDEKVTLLAEPKSIPDRTDNLQRTLSGAYSLTSSTDKLYSPVIHSELPLSLGLIQGVDASGYSRTKNQSTSRGNTGLSSKSRIILTTYPGQAGIRPLAMNWGHADPLQRGPVVVSRNQSTIRRRNGTILDSLAKYDSNLACQ